MMLTGSDELKPASSDLPVETRRDEDIIVISIFEIIKESV